MVKLRKEFNIVNAAIFVAFAIVVLNLLNSAIDLGINIPLSGGFILIGVVAAAGIPFVILRKGFNLNKNDLIGLGITVGIILGLIFAVPSLIGEHFTASVLNLKFSMLGF